jgi:glycosyltransferase involved in cell wall biosynthesis
VYRGLSVAVVMPAFDVAERVAGAVTTLPALVDWVVVVDDGSRDGTAAAVAALARPGLVLLRHPQNRGVGAAIATGYREALRRGAQVIAVMAGDGQMDPADLEAVLEPVASGRADYAKGNRFRHPEVWRAMPRDRLVGNVILSLLTKLTSGYRGLFDSQCGFTAISARALAAIDCRLYRRYGYPNDLLARLRVVEARVAEVTVRPIYDGQRSGIRLWTAFPILAVLARSFARRLWQSWIRVLAPRPALQEDRIRPALAHAPRPAPLGLPPGREAPTVVPRA